MIEREPLSVDDGAVWSDREMRVTVERARVEGWNAALDAVNAGRVTRGGLGGRSGEGDDLRRLVGERFATALEGVWLASLRYLRGTVADGDGGLYGALGVKNARRLSGGLGAVSDRGLMMGFGSGGGTGGRSGGRGVSASVGGVIRDEAALAFKAGIERKLRKLTRDMEKWLENQSSNREENVVLRCKKCRRFADEKWKFCPFDGEEVK